MRQIVLDTETTGLEASKGHRIIEIGCVELINRRLTGNNFHHYLNPEREIDAGAMEVHGITNESLVDKPLFADVAESFRDYARDAELVIHNASFDVGFLNHEFARLKGFSPVDSICSVLDTLAMARRMHPGQRNTLDALCKRYGINNSQRTLHGALLDAEILADVFLFMTGGQSDLSLEVSEEESTKKRDAARKSSGPRPELIVLKASEEEEAAHQNYLNMLEKASGGQRRWD